MSLTPSSFTQAEYVESPAPAPPPVQPPDAGVLVPSILLGLVGAAVGAVVYAGFIGITHIQIGYLSIGVAYLIAKAMLIGSKGRGGREFQITAIVLTCLSVAAGNAMLMAWNLHQQGLNMPLSLRVLWILLKYGLTEPFLEFQDSPVGALLGLFILFIGLRAAWRMTSGEPGAAQHPFSR